MSGLPAHRLAPTRPVAAIPAAAVVWLLLGAACGGRGWLRLGGAGGQALALWGQRGSAGARSGEEAARDSAEASQNFDTEGKEEAEELGEAAEAAAEGAAIAGQTQPHLRGKAAAAPPPPPVVAAGVPLLVRAPLVELQVESHPLRVAKVVVPICPQVAKWWTEDHAKVTARVEPSLTGVHAPRVLVQIIGGRPLEVAGLQAQGVHLVVDLPEGAVLEDCHVGSVRVTADFEPLVGLGPIRALLIVCPVRPGAGASGPLLAVRVALASGGPLRWLVLPWLLLLLPFYFGSSIGPVALLGGACLTLASIACLSFVAAVVIVVVQRRCALCTRRWRRLYRLRALARRPASVHAAFGDAGPCCICLAEADSNQRDRLIALLPCRHALHDECYSSWVGADAYPSHELICPLCRARTEAIGKLAP